MSNFKRTHDSDSDDQLREYESNQNYKKANIESNRYWNNRDITGTIRQTTSHEALESTSLGEQARLRSDTSSGHIHVGQPSLYDDQNGILTEQGNNESKVKYLTLETQSGNNKIVII